MPVIAVSIVDVDVEHLGAKAVGAIHQRRFAAGELHAGKAAEHEARIACGAEGEERMRQTRATIGTLPELRSCRVITGDPETIRPNPRLRLHSSNEKAAIGGRLDKLSLFGAGTAVG